MAYRQLELNVYTMGGSGPPWYSVWFHKMARDEECYILSFFVTNGQCYITDNDMQLIGRFEELVQLSLFDQEAITDDGLRNIDSLRDLKKLGLGHTNITDKGLWYLRSMQQLEFLDLSDTQITDSGLRYMAHLKGLHKLRMSGTGVTDAGIAELQKALPNCKIER